MLPKPSAGRQSPVQGGQHYCAAKGERDRGVACNASVHTKSSKARGVVVLACFLVGVCVYCTLNLIPWPWRTCCCCCCCVGVCRCMLRRHHADAYKHKDLAVSARPAPPVVWAGSLDQARMQCMRRGRGRGSREGGRRKLKRPATVQRACHACRRPALATTLLVASAPAVRPLSPVLAIGLSFPHLRARGRAGW